MGCQIALVMVLLSVVLSALSLPEENMNAMQLMRYWGYEAEEHEIETQDGYILTVHRIPRGKTENLQFGKTSKGEQRRPVMFLQHGLLCSSTNWLTNLPEQSLAYILADAGFDVWMGNVRGNTYSRKHRSLSITDEKFWDFTWDDMAQYDLPAMIDYALAMTQQEKLSYVGHSQGTLMAFAGLSENKTLANHVNLFIALAPVWRVDHMISPFRYLAYFAPEASYFFNLFGKGDFLPSTWYIKWLAGNVCPSNEPLCNNLMFVIAGYDTQNLNSTRIPVYASHVPAGTSVKNFIHYGQMYLDGNPGNGYNHGAKKNIAKYGTKEPHQYNLANLKTPVVAYSGGNDWLADPTDVDWLMQQIPHLVKHRRLPKYNHLDFLWGINANTELYFYMQELLTKYNM